MYVDKITYIRNPLIEENEFPKMKATCEELPSFNEFRENLPKPFWKGHQSAIDCYWKAWQLAYLNLRRATPENGFVSNFIDSAFSGDLFMWDSAFILQFGKYAMHSFNFLATLDNFYVKQHPDGFICRQIREDDGEDCISRHDPTSTGPNIMAWTEWDYFQLFGDIERLKRVYPPLAAYYQWLKLYRTWPDGTYWYSGWGSGLDNQPRQETLEIYARNKNELRRYREFSHGHMSWIDACLHQIMSAKYLIKMAKAIGRDRDVQEFKHEIDFLTQFVNAEMWDERPAYYYDRYSDGRLSAVMSIVSYWALLAGVVPQEKLERFISHLKDPKKFNRPHRAPSLSADNPEYDKKGDYWNGGVWAPTNYMVMRGLSYKGYDDLAHEIAKNHLDNVVKVFENTGTIWENYAPESASPGNEAKSDFVGWSGLGPIAVLLENVFGIWPQVAESRIIWRIKLLEEHGVDDYPFGKNGVVNLRCKPRKSDEEEPKVNVESNVPLRIELIWKKGNKAIKVSGK